MKCGVIGCPRCKNVKAIFLKNKTTRCNRCGKIINIKKAKVLFETDSQEKISNFIGEFNKNQT